MDDYLTLLCAPFGIAQPFGQTVYPSGESLGRDLCDSSLVSPDNADHTATDQAVFRL
jgi:hypothetical protein